MRLNTSKVGLSSSPNGSGSTSPTPAGWTALLILGLALPLAAQPAIPTNAPTPSNGVSGLGSSATPQNTAPSVAAGLPSPLTSSNVTPAWLSQPLSVVEAVNVALRHNSAILKSQNDLEANQGIIMQTRAVALPRLRTSGVYRANDAGLTEKFPFEGTGGTAASAIDWPSQSWSLGLEVVQTVYEGGRIRSALRSSRLLRAQALLLHQAVLNDAVTDVRVAYATVLAAAAEIKVRQQSVQLLTREFEDMSRRFEAGTVPRFNVLRAEVELANARPRLSTARNAWRIAKNNLVNLMGLNLPAGVLEDIPLNLSDPLQADPYTIQLPAAIAQAWERRPELQALQKSEQLRREDIVAAKAGSKPTFELFTGYQGRNSSFYSDLSREVHGWTAGAQFNWNIFDGLATQGKVKQAQALRDRSHNEIAEALRRIELEVRTAYSTFLEANEVLGSTVKVVEQAEEALRLAKARADAGTSTQLDVLTAETSLTEAGNTRNIALREYVVARVRLERAIGQPIIPVTPPPAETQPTPPAKP